MTKRLMLMRFRAIRLIAHLLVSAWIGSAAAVSPALGGNVSAQAPLEGVFTGAFDRGVPVYRLPSISVSAKRNVEAARRSAQARRVDRARVTQGVLRAS
ncbi:MAG: hypothetical protein E6H78_11710 [Betaproteobacteria bacterium]|nr:MAG: hypothetical protein E6H78_11710 [Betaproteobacteria bacterium]